MTEAVLFLMFLAWVYYLAAKKTVSDAKDALDRNPRLKEAGKGLLGALMNKVLKK